MLKPARDRRRIKNRSNLYICTECEESKEAKQISFHTKKNLKKHMKSHKKPKPRPKPKPKPKPNYILKDLSIKSHEKRAFETLYE